MPYGSRISPPRGRASPTHAPSMLPWGQRSKDRATQRRPLQRPKPAGDYDLRGKVAFRTHKCPQVPTSYGQKDSTIRNAALLHAARAVSARYTVQARSDAPTVYICSAREDGITRPGALTGAQRERGMQPRLHGVVDAPLAGEEGGDQVQCGNWHTKE